MAYGLNVQVSRIAKKENIPCITSIHSYFGRYWNQLFPLNLVLRHMEKSKIERDQSRLLHVPSEYLAGRIRKYVKGKSRIVVVPNWLPEDIPKPKKIAEKTILFV